MIHAGKVGKPFERQSVGFPRADADMPHPRDRAQMPGPVAWHEVEDADAGVDRERRRFDERLEAAVGAR